MVGTFCRRSMLAVACEDVSFSCVVDTKGEQAATRDE